jgi:hypothetical protein
MLGARLLQLIQAHAGSLTNEVIVDLRTNERTPSFGRLSLSNLELHSIQELNYQVGEFFDHALYHLTRGYEAEAAIVRRLHAPSRLSA